MVQRIIRFITIIGLVYCGVVSLSGCANGPRTVAFVESDTRLLILNDENHEDGIKKNRPMLLESDGHKINEQKVITKCSAVPSVEASPIPAVLGLLLGSFINVTFDKIDQALQDEIKKYSQAYSASQGTSFYKKANISDSERVATEINCLRFVRARKTGETSEEDHQWIS